MNWTINQSALQEYQEAAEWYRERSLQAAERFIFEVETAIHAICADPGVTNRSEKACTFIV
jgi:plasmid stabilization system protein ParE